MVLITIVTGANLNQLITGGGGHIVGFSWRFPKSWWYRQFSSKSLDHVSIETDLVTCGVSPLKPRWQWMAI